MKKLCQKHSLLVGALITLLLAVLFSWVFPEAYYSNGKLGLSYAEKFGLFASTANDTKVGLFDITTYGQLVIYYFTTIFVFAFVVAGFYKLLGSTAAYQKLTDNIAKKFEGKEKIFVGISAFIIACISGISTEQFAIFALIGATTKLDLTKMGTYLLMGLIGIIICGVINIFVGSSSLDFILSVIGVILFLGYTAYDVKLIMNSDKFAMIPEENLAIYGALELYLDFINLFIRLIEFFGKRSDN